MHAHIHLFISHLSPICETALAVLLSIYANTPRVFLTAPGFRIIISLLMLVGRSLQVSQGVLHGRASTVCHVTRLRLVLPVVIAVARVHVQRIDNTARHKREYNLDNTA